MSERDEEAPDAGQERGRGARAGRTGRRVALGLYWAFMLYIMVISFYSLIPQIFFPTATSQAQAQAPASCEEGLRDLTASLRAHASAIVGGRDAESDATFFERWDDRHVAVAERCEGDARHRRVAVLRYCVETTLRRFHREDRRLFDEVARALGADAPRDGEDAARTEETP